MHGPPEEYHEEPCFILFTDTKITIEFTGSRAQSFHKIHLDEERKWSCRHVAALLNELQYTEPCVSAHYDEGSYQIFSFKSKDKDQVILHVYVHDDGRIEVDAHISFIKEYGEENNFMQNRSIDGQGRRLKKPKEYLVRAYSLSVPIKLGSSVAIINSLPMIFHPKDSFSTSCHLFIKKYLKLPSSKLQEDSDIQPLRDYKRSWISSKKKFDSVNSLDTFINSTIGYLHLTIIPNSPDRRLQRITIDNTEYSILCGIYISPFARSIFNNNADVIDGLLMDTTWKIISKYVTSILMCSSYNVGIPVAFAFGGAEDKDLYSMFTKYLPEVVGVDIKKFNVESDQGSALRAVCDGFEKTHFACLRHFLVSLKTKCFSFQLGKLLSCCSLTEFNTLMDIYSQALRTIDNEKTMKEIQSVLFKAGLTFDGREVVIVDEDKLNRVSMIKRVEARMPSTTNSLESSHGHLNSKLPRHNAFWPSLQRIATSITDKTFRYNEMMKHNYSRIKRDVKYRAKKYAGPNIQDQIRRFNSTIDSCECGETKLQSALLRINIPCSHQYTLGAEFPSLPIVNLELIPQWTKCEFAYSIVNAERRLPVIGEIDQLKTQCAKIIKRYSHFKNKAKIEEYVAAHMRYGSDFVLGKPIGYYEVTHSGILHFTNEANQAKKKR